MTQLYIELGKLPIYILHLHSSLLKVASLNYAASEDTKTHFLFHYFEHICYLKFFLQTQPLLAFIGA